jgi:nucleotide-sensitive chloride channel 1A
MALQILSTQPQMDAFTPLEEHQNQTPGTFFGGKPVLHTKHSGLTLNIPQEQLRSHPAIAKFAYTVVADGPTAGSSPATLANIELWVTSE